MASEGGVPIDCLLVETRTERNVGEVGRVVRYGWLVGGVIVTADSPGDPERRCKRAGVAVCFVGWWCGFRCGQSSSVLSGAVVFLFLVFYVQHFVLARFPLRLLLFCSVQYPPSRAAIGRWHIFYNPNWSRILNITHESGAGCAVWFLLFFNYKDERGVCGSGQLSASH